MADDLELFYTYDLSDPPRYHCRPIDRDYFDWLFDMLAGTGLTFLYRGNLAGRTYYRSKVMAPFDHGCVNHANSDAHIWYRIADALTNTDPLADAVRAARRHGVPIRAWINWNEFQCIRPDWISLVDPFWYERPRKYWCSRDGSRFYHGVPDFGDPDVQRRLLAMAREIMDYGVDGLYLSTRSHSWFPCYRSPEAQEDMRPFGFNDCVVETYQQRHGVNIRREEFDEEQWHRIKGEHFSQLLSRTGTLVHGYGKPFVVGVSPNRYQLMGMGDQWPGKKNILLYKDWEGWAAEGSIDGICSEQTCPHGKKLSGSDVSTFRETLPADFPLYSWTDTAWFEDRKCGPFSLGNWNRHSTDEVLQQVEMIRESGVRGGFIHSLYHYTAADTDGESLGGYGVLPRREYFDALRKRNG